MCRQAAMRIPFRGFSLANRSLISLMTGISRPAHSILCLPAAASFGSLISLFFFEGIILLICWGCAAFDSLPLYLNITLNSTDIGLCSSIVSVSLLSLAGED